MREERVIGRVIDGVADAGERKHCDHHPERIDEPHDDERRGANREAGNQEHACSQPVDQEASRCLQGCGNDVEYGERQADFRIAHAIFGAHERQQGRKKDNVVMRYKMCRADGADDPHIRWSARAENVSSLAHSA